MGHRSDLVGNDLRLRCLADENLVTKAAKPLFFLFVRGNLRFPLTGSPPLKGAAPARVSRAPRFAALFWRRFKTIIKLRRDRSPWKTAALSPWKNSVAHLRDCPHPRSFPRRGRKLCFIENNVPLPVGGGVRSGGLCKPKKFPSPPKKNRTTMKMIVTVISTTQ